MVKLRSVAPVMGVRFSLIAQTMEFSRWKNFFVAMIMLETLVAGFSFILNQAGNIDIGLATTSNDLQKNTSANIEENQTVLPDIENTASVEILPEKLSNPPKIIKAVYVTGWSAGSKSYLNYLTYLFKTTEINGVVIDIKDYSGLMPYVPNTEQVKKYELYNNAIPDINVLVRFFHNQNIYVIGRIAVFEDPAFSKARPDLAVFDKTKSSPASPPVLWYDNHKLSWLDPASKEVWDYNISIAKDVLLHGFDEINFDYIRFPSDGKTQNMGFPYWDEKTPMRAVLKNFYKYLRQELPDAKLSADLFGQTTVNSDDLGIGQIIEDSLEYFDFVCPMVYPSHYAENFMGFQNPADFPYEVVNYSMSTALKKETAYKNLKIAEITPPTADTQTMPEIKPEVKLAKFRPWLQDFNIGAIYTAEMVKQEIKATQDSLKENFVGYMLWSPSNVYTKRAIEKID